MGNDALLDTLFKSPRLGPFMDRLIDVWKMITSQAFVSSAMRKPHASGRS